MEILDFYDNHKMITDDKIIAALNKLALKAWMVRGVSTRMMLSILLVTKYPIFFLLIYFLPSIATTVSMNGDYSIDTIDPMLEFIKLYSTSNQPRMLKSEADIFCKLYNMMSV